MSASTFRILRQCENCGNMFEAQKRTTRFCSHRCASQNYKLRQKIERKKEVESTLTQLPLKPKVKRLDLEFIKHKEFLTVSEVAVLFGCSKKTVYRMIEANEINASNLSKRLTRIRRKDIEQLFEQPKEKQPDTLTLDNCYTMEQLTSKYNVSRNTIYSYVGKHSIQRIKEHGITYYSKADIDNLFS